MSTDETDYVQTRTLSERLRAAPREDPTTFWIVAGLVSAFVVVMGWGLWEAFNQ